MPSRRKNFTIRQVEVTDLQKGFFDTLSNLAKTGKVGNDPNRAEEILEAIKSNHHKIFVALDERGDVIGSTTLLIEQKFIHDGGRVGHIEDVVTRKGYELMGVGSELVRAAMRFAAEAGCYKVILVCSEEKVRFYQRLGFKKHSVCMRYDLR